MVQKKGGTVLSAASLSINKVLDGMDSFLYIRFSEFPDGRNMSSEPNEKTKYIGVVSTKENRPPSDPARYAWTAFKGADGEKTFLWVRYSEQDGGKPKMESNPSAKTQYMGVYSGPETTAPTDATKYRWVKTKGEQGESSYLHVRYSDYADGTGFYEKPKRTTMFIGVAVTVSEKAPVNKEAYDWAEFGVNIEFGGRNYILESLAPVVVKKQDSRKWINAYPSSRFSKDWPGYTGFAVATIHGYTSGTAYPENVRMRLVGLKGTSRVYEEEFVIPQSELKKKEFEHSHVFIIPESTSTANSYLLEVYSWTEDMELEIDRIKLERGNRPTDWSGAPEDVNNEMMEIKKESASLGVLIQKLESGKASTAELQALATELSGYVKSNTSYGGVKITDQGVLLDSTNMEVVLDQRNGFLIKTKKPGQTVLQVDKDGKFIINASNLNTEIEDTKKEIDKKIDEIEYGGRNYILNSEVYSQFYSNNQSSYPLRKGVDKRGNWFNGYHEDAPEKFYVSAFLPKLEDYASFSEDALLLSGNEVTLSMELWTESELSIRVGRSKEVTLKPNVWQRVSGTQAVTERAPGFLIQGHNTSSNNKVYHRNWKLEKGKSSTDWTRAPEEELEPTSSRNLLKNTAFMTDNTGMGRVVEGELFSGNRVIKSVKGARFTDTFKQRVQIPSEEQYYTVSFWAKSAKDGQSINCFFCSPNTTKRASTSQGRRGVAVDGATAITLTDEWERYWITWEQEGTSSNKDVIIGRVFEEGYNDVFISSIMMTTGRKASQWFPAPEDGKVYRAWSNSSDGTLDFSRVEPQPNLLEDVEGKVYTRNGANRGEFINDPNWDLTNIIETHGIDKTYTISFDLKTSKNGRVQVYMQSGSGSLYEFSGSAARMFNATTSWSRYSVTTKFIKKEVSFTNALLSFFGSPYGSGVFPFVKNIKVEISDAASPFTPSYSIDAERSLLKYEGLSSVDSEDPKDFTWAPYPKYLELLSQIGLENKVDSSEYENDWEEIQTSLGDKASKDELKEIEDLANQIQNEYEEFIKDGGRYEADLESLEKRISAMVLNLGDKIAEFNFINKYIKLGEEGLLLGDSTSLMNILISDKRISFFDAGKEVAYMEGQEFRINRGTILESLQVGSHKMEQVDANSTIFTFIS